ncbi:MAG TPA: type II toxin-antitoxin system VapC family toxin [Ktedonobacteraceae bacterium]|nr:type II toxin-antitoxin system VapC family toxin [Ktedonobacteraceae bacterium]
MNKFVVVDTSLALKWILQEHDSNIARALLIQWINQDVVLLSPTLLMYEITNKLHQILNKGNITQEEVRKTLRDMLDVEIVLELPEDFDWNIRAIELAQKYGFNAAYDAHFLVLAERKKCEFWTADARMWKAVRKDLPWVRLLDEYEPTN